MPHRKTDSDGKQVVVGVEEDAKLFCRTNAPWKKCLWKPPRNGVRQVGTIYLGTNFSFTLSLNVVFNPEL